MGRIFVGLCEVGAWGCFENLKEQLANQLNENITIELVGKQVDVNPHMAIFITMNPGYAGRSNLPDNLNKLFRSLAITQPDNNKQ
jgi:dynein heavy chain 1